MQIIIMDNWTKIEVGYVTLIHHSTASVIEIVVTNDDSELPPKNIWLDYYDFEALKDAIKKIQP